MTIEPAFSASTGGEDIPLQPLVEILADYERKLAAAKGITDKAKYDEESALYAFQAQQEALSVWLDRLYEFIGGESADNRDAFRRLLDIGLGENPDPSAVKNIQTLHCTKDFGLPTVLTFAAGKRKFSCVEALLERGFDPNFRHHGDPSAFENALRAVIKAETNTTEIAAIEREILIALYLKGGRVDPAEFVDPWEALQKLVDVLGAQVRQNMRPAGDFELNAVERLSPSGAAGAHPQVP